MEYLGQCIDAQGLHLIPEKVEAVKNASKLKNVTELKLSFVILYKIPTQFANCVGTTVPAVKS